MRRLMTLLASVLIAAALAPAMTGTAQAAEPMRSNSKNNPVIFIHGIKATDCADTWSTTRSFFREYEWTGPLITYGYYGGDTHCNWHYDDGTLDTNLNKVALDLARRIYNNYTRFNIKVDVVAYSMGGLIIRSALLHSGRTDSWPGRLLVEDVITIATPHRGSDAFLTHLCAIGDVQCRQMLPGSTFIDSLQVLGDGPDGHPRLPNGVGGTDWTVLASYQDDLTSVGSGTGVAAEHKIQYNAAECSGDQPGLEHTGFHRQRGIYCYRERNDFGSWSNFKDDAAHSPVARSYWAAYHHSTD